MVKRETVVALGTIMAVGIGLYAIQSSNFVDSGLYDYTALPLPDYAYTSSKVLKAYKIATVIPSIIEKNPCYCACGEIRDEQFPEGHKNLLHCYIDDKGKFTDHAVYCAICLNEVLDIYEWYNQDVPLKMIRAKIDEKYEKYGPGTDTPLP
jgi:hypothetical protein